MKNRNPQGLYKSPTQMPMSTLSIPIFNSYYASFLLRLPAIPSQSSSSSLSNRHNRVLHLWSRDRNVLRRIFRCLEKYCLVCVSWCCGRGCRLEIDGGFRTRHVASRGDR